MEPMLTDNLTRTVYATDLSSLGEGRSMKGVAFPLEANDERMGFMWDEKTGDIQMIAGTIYAAFALDKQLAKPDFGGRVQFLWQHGLEGGVTTIPIGKVTDLAIDKGVPHVTFAAVLNDTFVAQQLRPLVRDRQIKEVSVAIRTLDYRIETRVMDGEVMPVRYTTEAELADVSLVARAHFPQANVTEVFCDSCGTETPDGKAGGFQHGCGGTYRQAIAFECTEPPKPDEALDSVTVARDYLEGLKGSAASLQERLHASLARIDTLESDIRLADATRLVAGRE
jgi:phage head maturation protease